MDDLDELFDVFDPNAADPRASVNKKAAAAAAAGTEETNPPPGPQAGTADAPKREKRRNKKKKKDKNKKRKADGHMKNGSSNGDADAEMPDAGAAPSSNEEDSSDLSDGGHGDSKRRRKDVIKPLMTDSFQTAESRQVAAAAGLAPTQADGEGEEEADGDSLVLSHNIQHQVALPPDLNYEYIPLSEHKSPADPARKYSFKLDPFQQLAISSIERNESVLVSAHTSAGKTVVAEYAIAQCLKRTQRIIYTSPIKALSNQKYRDFQAEFSDVGLMTGDVTINPTASCLVMTTEILRSMLYRGSEIMREVAWVVFDEIHYLRDATRGVVWEETIILLPDNVRYVFLSATIPNAFQFAEWIAKIHRQACHVVYTDFRPTPLQNYAHPCGANGIWLIVDEKGNFKEKNFQLVMDKVDDKKSTDSFKMKGKGKNKRQSKGGEATGAEDQSDIYRIVKMVVKKKYNPVILFSFSKREIENLALSISKLNFNNTSESAMVERVFHSAIESLAEEDRELPQISNILPLLRRGIGVHHAGLLPILKETIEILFQEGLIKVLFATETFSIGLNMPAKTVVFTAVEKWDGKKSRPLTSSEYIQMSGRAGRRGLDDRGVVIMMINEKMPPDTARAIVHGQQDRLNSAFHLSYNMVLNLLRIETVSPEYMLERCFYQFQNAASVPDLEKELIENQHERDNMIIADEATVKEYYNIRSLLDVYTKDMRTVIQHPDHCIYWLSPGRTVNIYDPETRADFGWGVVIDVIGRKSEKKEEFTPQESKLVVVGLPLRADSKDFAPNVATSAIPEGIKPADPDNMQNEEFKLVPCLLTCIKAIGQVRVFVPKDLKEQKGIEKLGKILKETKRRLPDGIPLLDPIETMEITDESFKKLMRKIEVLEARLLSNPLHGSDLLPSLYEQYSKKVQMTEKIKELKKSIEKAHSISQLDELKSRKRVLRRLGFINEQEVVQLKARVACEISSTENHELLLSELLLNRFFNDLSPEVVAATLSCFVFEEKIKTEALKEYLAKPYAQIREQARIIAKVSQESKLEFSEEEYLNTIKWELMETVHQWANGASFADICKIADIYEGSLIRVFRRLEELLRQMGQAARVMGSEELTKLFEESLGKIRRSIVAAQSLYL
ncbi:ATP-dependent RNA helicase DOB1 [Zalerion maritima]|uniref:ATP-dependent RNA helicase DOB1 n=1 Tax=Zalerion maritima TaxID=339359 RepID=A0AAD5WVC6_9PEZI|nr:ATP-dependent RNA helicase DOB1 [Zalerion maritima]